jgi:hypothetical protein
MIEFLLMIDAARRASANQVVAVIPYFGLARQDRKDKPRVSIGAKLMANLPDRCRVSRVITMDLHADQIQGFFDVPVDHLVCFGHFCPLHQVAEPSQPGYGFTRYGWHKAGCSLCQVYEQRTGNLLQAALRSMKLNGWCLSVM